MTCTKLVRTWVTGEYEVTDRRSGRRLGFVRKLGAGSRMPTQWLASDADHQPIPGPDYGNRWGTRADAAQAVADLQPVAE